MTRHREHFDPGKIRLVNILALLFGFLDGFFIYVLSTYFAVASGNDNVGAYYVIAYAGVLALLFFLQPLIRSIGKARALYLFLGITILASALLTRIPIGFAGIVIAVAFLVSTTLQWTVMDILLESFSQDRLSGRIRGMHLTAMNVGILLAPFLSTLTLEQYSYPGVFFVLLIGYIGAFLVALVGLRNHNTVFQQKILVRETLGKMWKEKNLLRVYHISFAMEFFYALVLVYTPIYLRSLGLSWHDLGIIFTVMLVPFAVLQYPLGVLADRKWGEKELLVGSIFVLSVSTLFLGLTDSRDVLVWGVLLFVTRIGVAGIEILRDSYFYKQIDADDMDVIAFFRTARPLANIFGAGLSVAFLLFWPIKSVFFVAAAMVFLSLFTAYFLTDSQSERELTVSA